MSSLKKGKTTAQQFILVAQETELGFGKLTGEQ